MRGHHRAARGRRTLPALVLSMTLAGCAAPTMPPSPEEGDGAADKGWDGRGAPAALLQLTSKIVPQPLTVSRLADPYIAPRVAVCEAMGRRSCRVLLAPSDVIAIVTVGQDPAAIAFATVTGLQPAHDYRFGLTITPLPVGPPLWTHAWTYRTPDDFAPRLELTQWQAIPGSVLPAAPGNFSVAFTIEERPTAAVTFASRTAPP